MEKQKNDRMISKTKIVLIVSIISTVLFVICMILLVNFILTLHFDGYYMESWDNRRVQFVLFFVFILFSFIYIPYILFSTIFIYFKYKNIIYINLISTAILCVFYILYTTGFCFQKMRYLSKVEITDKIVDIYVNHNCYDEYRSKHDNMTYDSIRHKDVIKECSISFESIKQEAPQCFTDKRENNCKGTVTHFDKKANSVVKKEIYVYSYGEYGHGIFSSFEYLRYSIGSGLDMSEDRDNIPIMGCCGTVKSVGMWD